jgi:hypothetical protein
MTELEKISAIEDIRQLKSRYFRFVDAKNWDGLADVFCKDAVFGTHRVRGNREIAKMICQATDGVTTVHHGHCQEVWIEADDRAGGTTAFEDRGYRMNSIDLVMHGFGRYEEVFHLEDGEWRIFDTRISRMSVLPA